MAKSASVKPWKLTEEETFASYTSWQQNMLYCLNQDAANQPLLLSQWQKLTSNNPNRGFTNDAGENGLTKEQKVYNLHLMLGYLSQFVPHYLSHDIQSNSTSIDSVWQFIRSYYGFQQSETQFLKYASITWEGMQSERPERLYRRILAHLQDNLLQSGSRLKHNEETPTKTEEISPTVERLAVLRWMELIHPKLPMLVARTFAYDLQRMTLKDLQPQIVNGIDGFLEELQRDDISVSRVSSNFRQHDNHTRPSHQNYNRQNQSRQNTWKPRAKPNPPYQSKLQCRVCRAEGRSSGGHSLATCPYVAEAERQEIVKTYKVETSYEQEELQEDFNDLAIKDESE